MLKGLAWAWYLPQDLRRWPIVLVISMPKFCKRTVSSTYRRRRRHVLLEHSGAT